MGGPSDRPPPLSTARCVLHGFKLVDPIGPLPRYVAAAIAAVSELVFDEPFSMCRQRRLSRRWPRSSRGHVSEDWTYQTEQTCMPRRRSRWHIHHTHTYIVECGRRKLQKIKPTVVQPRTQREETHTQGSLHYDCMRVDLPPPSPPPPAITPSPRQSQPSATHHHAHLPGNVQCDWPCRST